MNALLSFVVMFRRKYNISSFLTCFKIPGGLDDLFQEVRSINDRIVLTCLDELHFGKSEGQYSVELAPLGWRAMTFGDRSRSFRSTNCLAAKRIEAYASNLHWEEVGNITENAASYVERQGAVPEFFNACIHHHSRQSADTGLATAPG